MTSNISNISKIQWSSVKEEKFIFPLFLTKFNFSKIFTQIVYFKNYLFIFIDYDLVVYSFYYNKKPSTLDLNENNQEFSLTFENKKNLDFFSSDEEILFIKCSDKHLKYDSFSSLFNSNVSNITNKTSFSENNYFNFVIGTNLGNIFLINFNLTDFYLEISHTFNIKHNYIHEYEILFYTIEEYINSHNIIMTMDKHLFLLEFQNSSYNFLNSSDNKIFKNLLLRIEDPHEKVINAFVKPKHYTVIFSNKSIYLINFDTDGTSEIIFKKDPSSYNSFYSGYVYKDVIYYIKDSNSFSIFHIYDRENKFTIKLSAKNQLNELAFSKVLNVDDEVITITNDKRSEIYFIINKKFKLVQRENILFDKSFFIFVEDSLVVISLNLSNLCLKYKYALFSNLRIPINCQIKDPNKFEIPNNYNQIDKKQRKNSESILFDSLNLNLNEIEVSFLDSKKYIQNLNFKFKKLWNELNFLMNKIFHVVEYNKFEFIKKKICCKMNKFISLSKKFKYCSNQSEYVYDQINKSYRLNYYNLPKSFNNIQSKMNFLKFQIITSYIKKFGSEILLKSLNILIDYFKNLHGEKIKNLIKIAILTRDKEVYLKLIN